MNRRAREVTRLGGDVEVLREGTAGHEACTFLDADNVPGSVKVVCQSALI